MMWFTFSRKDFLRASFFPKNSLNKWTALLNSFNNRSLCSILLYLRNRLLKRSVSSSLNVCWIAQRCIHRIAGTRLWTAPCMTLMSLTPVCSTVGKWRSPSGKYMQWVRQRCFCASLRTNWYHTSPQCMPKCKISSVVTAFPSKKFEEPMML